MIDWLQAVIPYRHQIEFTGGLVQSTKPGGELEWQRDKLASVEGSYSTTVAVRSQNKVAESVWTEVYISGNPAKFLQGHNAFGSDDLLGLLCAMFERAIAVAGLVLDDFTRARLLEGRDVKVTMVDVTYMYDLSSREQVRSFIRSLAHTGYMRHRGRGEFKGETLYYGKRTRYWAMKVYCKGDELDSRKKGHKLALPYQNGILSRDGLRIRNYCDNKVRFELRFLPKELKRLGLEDGQFWRSVDVPASLYAMYLERLQVSSQKMKESEALRKLTSAEYKAYYSWKSGIDPRTIYSRSGYYKLRAKLLKHGIDIGATPPPKKAEKVFEMLPVVVATPATIPDWALGGRHTYFDTDHYRKQK